MKQAPVVHVKREREKQAKKSRSGKSGWQAWKEKRQIVAGLEESRRQGELALLKAKVEAASPEPENLQVVQCDPASSSSQAVLLASPVPPFPLEENLQLNSSQDKGVQTVLSLLKVRDEDTQTPDWRRPYVLGLPVRQAYPHYINGVPPDDAPSPDPRVSKTRHRAASLSPSTSRRRDALIARKLLVALEVIRKPKASKFYPQKKKKLANLPSR